MSEVDYVFPSDDFLSRYYRSYIEKTIQSVAKDGETNQAVADFSLREFIRKQFDEIFIYSQIERMRLTDHYEKSFERLYLFREKKCVDWVKDMLIDNKWWPELTETAQAELFDEFLGVIKTKSLPKDDWWDWFYGTDSVWVCINEQAKPIGQNRPHRTLKELLGE